MGVLVHCCNILMSEIVMFK